MDNIRKLFINKLRMVDSIILISAAQHKILFSKQESCRSNFGKVKAGTSCRSQITES